MEKEIFMVPNLLEVNHKLAIRICTSLQIGRASWAWNNESQTGQSNVSQIRYQVVQSDDVLSEITAFVTGCGKTIKMCVLQSVIVWVDCQLLSSILFNQKLGQYTTWTWGFACAFCTTRCVRPTTSLGKATEFTEFFFFFFLFFLLSKRGTYEKG